MIDTLLTWLPNIATVLLVICYVPQIYSNARYKSSEINAWFFILLILALSTFLVYNILLYIKFGAWHGIITEAANVLLAVVVFIQVLMIKKSEA